MELLELSGKDIFPPTSKNLPHFGQFWYVSLLSAR